MKSRQQAACEAALALCSTGDATAEDLDRLKQQLRDATGPPSVHVAWDREQVELAHTANDDQWSSPCCRYFIYRTANGWLATESFRGEGKGPQDAVDELEANLRKRVGEEG